MSKVQVPESEIEFSAVRASGPGGQHVNKVSTAVQLRFDIRASSLPVGKKQSLLDFRDKRISSDGVITIKAQRFRSQDRNRQDAIDRLNGLIERATSPKKKRIATKPGRAVKEKRLQDKKKQSEKKSGRTTVRVNNH